MKKTLSYIGVLVLICACNTTESAESDLERLEYVPEQNRVDVMILEESVFRRELVSNGRLRAYRKSNLRFDQPGVLVERNVNNGDRVETGQLIGKLDQTRQVEAVNHAKVRLEQARIQLKDNLIGQGYDPEITGEIPNNVLEIAKVRSGYRSAESDLNSAILDLDGTVLKAPFSGTIANLTTKVFEEAGQPEAFCTLIDHSEFEVEFHVMEGEMKDIWPGKVVTISPFFRKEATTSAHISSINPVVGDNGLISVTARVSGRQELMEGMNVRVLVETKIPRQLIVPKEAVLLRDNLEVLFTYTNGKAYWTYVHTVEENSTSYAVVANEDRAAVLAPGDTVIVTNNLYLAHDSEVEIAQVWEPNAVEGISVLEAK